MPIVMLAIFDQGGLKRVTLENDPKAYLSIAHGMFFNDRLFINWILRAAWNAIVIFFVVVWSIGDTDVSGSSGQNHGLWLTSTVVYSVIVFLPTIRILLECQSINVFVLFFIICSFCGYFPVVLLCSHLQSVNPNLYGTFDHIFSDGFIWCVIIFATSIPLLVDVSVWSLSREYRPSYIDVLQERQRLPRAEVLRMEEREYIEHQQSNTTRVRNRAVPQRTQQEKDEQLLLKIKKALHQAQQEKSKATANSAAGAQDSQRRAEALVYTMTRLQNLSGSNFDATPQRGVMSLYDVQSPLTKEQLEELRNREATIAQSVQHQHEVERVKQEQLAQQLHASRARDEQELARATSEDSNHQAHVSLPPRRKASLRASNSGADEHVFGLHLSDEDLSDAEEEHHMDEHAAAGRIHLHGQLNDEMDEDDEEKTSR